MITRVTIVAENDRPMALLGEDANEKVKTAWDSILKLIAIQGNDKVYVESAEVWDNEQTDCPKTCPSIDICTRDDTDRAWKGEK